MSNEPQRNILLCVAGLTPQIITETLYAVTQTRGEQVDEVRVITTLEGRNAVQRMLLDPQHGEFFRLCQDYDLDAEHIKFDETTIALLRTPDGRTLDDIRTPEENEYAGDQICEIVRELARDTTTRIHASAAGGRKTMSIYLTAAMQLFGRAHDVLSHVLVSPEFETNREFFYPPPIAREVTLRDGRIVSTNDAHIYLADVPFIRLRGLSTETLHKSGASLYGELVESAQAVLDVVESEYDLYIDLRRNILTINNRRVTLSAREMFFYLLFARARVAGKQQGALALSEVRERDFAKVFTQIMEARGESWEWASASTYPKFDFLIKMTNLVKRKDGDSLTAFTDEMLVIIARIKKKLIRKGCDERYAVTLRDERGTTRYGLAIAPERIKFGAC